MSYSEMGKEGRGGERRLGLSITWAWGRGNQSEASRSAVGALPLRPISPGVFLELPLS